MVTMSDSHWGLSSHGQSSRVGDASRREVETSGTFERRAYNHIFVSASTSAHSKVASSFHLPTFAPYYRWLGTSRKTFISLLYD